MISSHLHKKFNDKLLLIHVRNILIMFLHLLLNIFDKELNLKWEFYHLYWLYSDILAKF